MKDREKIEALVEFLCDNGLWAKFVQNMESKGYEVIEDEDSDYFQVK